MHIWWLGVVLSDQLTRYTTPRRAEAVAAYTRSRCQQTAARLLGVNQSTVSRLLAGASSDLSARLGRDVDLKRLIRAAHIN